MTTIAIVDYGMSNLRSVAKALESVARAGERILVTGQPGELSASDRVVVPGQGAIGQCMDNLSRLGLRDALAACIRERPYLGICLGLQSLMESSDENGGTPGLGLLPGRVVRFADGARDAHGERCKIPHMGWNRVTPKQPHPLWQGIEPGTRFYFVHSYYVAPGRTGDVAATTDYIGEFTSAVARENVFAVQFHPEKSQRAGLQLLRNFLDWRP